MTRTKILYLLLSLATTVIATGPGLAADLVATNSDWKVYRHGTGKDQMCFAVSPAQEVRPQGDTREPPHVYVTFWPLQDAKAEVSVLAGFALKPDSDVTLEISGEKFALIPDKDRGFVGDAAEELRLVEAMRRGSRMTMEAISDKGVRLRQGYSLSGVTASLQAIASGCS